MEKRSKVTNSQRRINILANHLLNQTKTSSNQTTINSNLSTAATTSKDDTLTNVDNLEELSEHESIVSILTPLLSQTSPSQNIKCEYCWRLARAHERLWQASILANKKDDSQHHFSCGFNNSKQAVQNNNHSGQANKWYAIFLAMEADIGGVVKSAKNAALIDKHLRIALKELHDDSTLHFMLGRITFSCASATWSERTAAKLVGYTIPTATYIESMKHFRRAQKLNSNVTNCLWLGKAYLRCEKNANKSKELGKKWLNRACKMKCVTNEDINSQKDAIIELKKSK
jgi:hypothetical protein